MPGPPRRLHYRRFDLRLVNSCTDAEACALVDRALLESDDRVGLVLPRPFEPAAPDGSAASRVYLKAEFRRPTETLVRRLRRARAYREGEGYLAFAAAGIPVAELLVYGEQPRWMPRGGAIVATGVLRGRDAARICARTGDPGPVLAVARLLATIHARNLTHGDAALRNFLHHGGRTTVIDLPSWGRFSRERAELDLARLIGSAMKYDLRDDTAGAALDAYVTTWPEAVRAHAHGFEGRVLRQAVEYADYIAERDRTRTDRHRRRGGRRRRPQRPRGEHADA